MKSRQLRWRRIEEMGRWGVIEERGGHNTRIEAVSLYVIWVPRCVCSTRHTHPQKVCTHIHNVPYSCCDSVCRKQKGIFIILQINIAIAISTCVPSTLEPAHQRRDVILSNTCTRIWQPFPHIYIISFPCFQQSLGFQAPPTSPFPIFRVPKAMDHWQSIAHLRRPLPSTPNVAPLRLFAL